MSLVPEYDVSSSEHSSDSEDENIESASDKTTPASHIATNKLPTPGFINDKSENVLTSSVFKNPFVEAENAKKALLEKHVKMVNVSDNTDFLNGKKICWNYRKGRCRFGHNCKFAHDSDLQKTKEQLDAENQIQETVVCQSQPLPQPTTQDVNQIVQENVAQKRKRPGLSQGLIPGKKVMKNYFIQKK